MTIPAPHPPVRRLPWIDFWRGLGLVIVIVGHAYALTGYAVSGDSWLAYSARCLVAAFGKRIVEFFFLASGFLICGIMLRLEGSRRPWLNYVKNRARRLLPAFVAYLLAIWALHISGVAFAADPTLVPGGMWWVVGFATNWLAILHPERDLGILVIHFWSLATEEQLCLVAPIIFLALRRFPKAAGRCIVSGTVLVPLAGIAWCLIVGPNRNILWSPFMQVDAFALGMWLATIQSPPRFERVRFPAWAALCLPFCVSAWAYGTKDESVAMLVVTILAAKLCVGLWFVLLCRAIAAGPECVSVLVGRFFELLGRRIYGVYVWHNLILLSTFELLRGTGYGPFALKKNGGLFCVFALWAVLATLTLCQVSWLLFKQFRVRKQS